LNDALKFSELDGDEEKRQHDARKKAKRGPAVITYGSLAHLFVLLYMLEKHGKK
jgi:hypothetical protein